MNKTLRDTLILGFALFAIFFGAGNLIFPPAIGLVSGTNWVTALIGFVLTGIVLPLLGVIAILNAEGKFEVLTKPISPWFYRFFNAVMMIGIGMCVMPLFLALYPVSIVIVFLGVFRKYIPNAGAYKGAVLMTLLTAS